MKYEGPFVSRGLRARLLALDHCKTTPVIVISVGVNLAFCSVEWLSSSMKQSQAASDSLQLKYACCKTGNGTTWPRCSSIYLRLATKCAQWWVNWHTKQACSSSWCWTGMNPCFSWYYDQPGRAKFILSLRENHMVSNLNRTCSGLSWLTIDSDWHQSPAEPGVPELQPLLLVPLAQHSGTITTSPSHESQPPVRRAWDYMS